MSHKRFKFWHDLLKHVTSRKKIRLADTIGDTGACWGVDISSWVFEDPHHHAELATVLSSQSNFYYEPTKLMLRIRQRHNRLVELGIAPLYVFPGARNPIRLERRRDQQCLEFLQEFVNNTNIMDGTSQPYIEVRKACTHLHRSVHYTDPKLWRFLAQWLRDEVVAGSYDTESGVVLGAPMEPYWQLVDLEQRGVIEGVFGHHHALVGAGVQRLLAHSMYNGDRKMSALLYERRQLQHIPLKGNKHQVRNLRKNIEEIFPEILALYGTEYSQRPVGEKLSQILRRLPSLLEHYQRGSPYWENVMTQPPGQQHFPRAKTIEEYSQRFQWAANQFRYGPVVRPNNGTARVEPLQPLPEGKTWKECLGYDPIECLPISGSDEYGKAMRFEGSCTFVEEATNEDYLPWYSGAFPIRQGSAENSDNIVTQMDFQRVMESRAYGRKVDDRDPILGW